MGPTLDAPRPVPLTIVGGFLGAGKTSLLNHLLTNAGGRSVAVLVNDFGEVNIDARLIVSVSGDTVSLANGCVCCTIREDLLAEVIKLFERPHLPEHVVIETSGVSNPRIVAETFLNPAAQRFVELRNIIAVLDAELAIADRADYRAHAMDQIAAADLVVVNKTDLIAQEQRSALRAQIGAAAPRARVWETSFGVVPPELVFDDALTSALIGPIAVRAPGFQDGHRGGFAAWIYRSEHRWSFNEIQRAVEKLPTDVYRVKGTLKLDLGEDTYGIFQLTGKRSWLTLREAGPAETVRTELVFVGQPGTVTNESIRLQMEEAVADAQAGLREGAGYLVKDLRAFTVYFAG